MKQISADNFFQDVNFTSIIETLKGVFMSDGTIATLLDFERCLDEANLYAFKNWLYGELVQGPDVKRYTVSCIFMWPYKLMPDPTGIKRLLSIGCDVKVAKSKIDVPVEIHSKNDFVQGTRYPKMSKKNVWFVQIEIPKELMDETKEGSIDIADQTIDLEDIDEAYQDDLDKEGLENQQGGPQQMPGMGPDMGGGMDDGLGGLGGPSIGGQPQI